jgi:hypothetical protein
MKHYHALPMLLPEDQIACAVIEIVDEANSPSPPTSLQVAEVLVGMVSRQSSHMKPFAPAVAARIEHWAASVWPTASVQLIDALATLLVNTDSGLARRVLTEAAALPDERVRKIAHDALRELA